MREGLSRLEAESRGRALSTAGLVIEIPDADRACRLCLGPTVVQKSTERSVITLAYGAFIAHVTVRVCSGGCRYPSGVLVTVHPEMLSRLVGPGGNFAYDVEVFVGIERLVHHRQREEIREDLRTKYGIELSSGQVSELTLRFCEHLGRLHRRSDAAIREVLRRDGGYPLHIDATGEAGRGTLFVAYAGWRDWVLGAWKIPTERADQMTPRLREVKDSFGPPCAVMRDLGRAVTLAAQDLVAELDTPIPILACHQHFLRDVGEDLLEDAHDTLRNLFRRFRVRPKLRTLVRDLGRQLATNLPAARDDVAAWAEQSDEHVLPDGEAGLAAVRSLAQWVLDSAHDSSHLGFPFERPYLDLCYRGNKPLDSGVPHAIWAERPCFLGASFRASVRIMPLWIEPETDSARILRVFATLGLSFWAHYGIIWTIGLNGRILRHPDRKVPRWRDHVGELTFQPRSADRES